MCLFVSHWSTFLVQVVYLSDLDPVVLLLKLRARAENKFTYDCHSLSSRLVHRSGMHGKYPDNQFANEKAT